MRANNVGSPHLAIDAPSTTHLSLRTTSLMNLLLSRYYDDHHGIETSRPGNNKWVPSLLNKFWVILQNLSKTLVFNNNLRSKNGCFWMIFFEFGVNISFICNSLDTYSVWKNVPLLKRGILQHFGLLGRKEYFSRKFPFKLSDSVGYFL